MYDLIAAVVLPALAKPLQKLAYPLISDSKSGRPPKGCTGLHDRLSPRIASAAVTSRAGEVFHIAPVRRVIV